MITKFHDYDVILRRLSEQRMGELEFVPNLNLARVVAVTRNMTEATRLRVLQTGADDLIADALSHEDIFMKVQNPSAAAAVFRKSRKPATIRPPQGIGEPTVTGHRIAPPGVPHDPTAPCNLDPTSLRA
jgi:hypothetical protein